MSEFFSQTAQFNTHWIFSSSTPPFSFYFCILFPSFADFCFYFLSTLFLYENKSKPISRLISFSACQRFFFLIAIYTLHLQVPACVSDSRLLPYSLDVPPTSCTSLNSCQNRSIVIILSSNPALNITCDKPELQPDLILIWTLLGRGCAPPLTKASSVEKF